MTFSSPNVLKQQIQDAIETLPPNLLPLILDLINLLRSRYPGPPPTESPPPGDAWDLLQQMAGTVEAPADWSRNHDHYLYGTPKQDE